MSGFSELIKNFDKTRDYLRDFFIYGFKVRNEFDRKSARTYDNEKRRAESWLGDAFGYENTKRGKQAYISADSGKISENPLYKAYRSKSFTDNDIRLHFLITDILSEGDFLSVREISDRLNENYGILFDDQTVRNKLKEYVNEGIIVSQKRGKTDFFSLSGDTYESFFDEYEGLWDFLKFFSESSEFGVVGNSILNSADIKNDIFLIKHNYIVHTLEDEILLKILDAMERKQFVTLTNFNKRGGVCENTGVPLKIHVSTQTGRRYLIMFMPKRGGFNSFRLDSVKKIKAFGKCEEYDKILCRLNEDEKKCFGVSFSGAGDSKAPQTVRITFFADEENEKYIIERLKREKRCGTLNKTGEDLFTLTFEIFDPNELMYWLKSFIGRIVSIEGAGDFLTQRFISDIERLNEMYSEEAATV